MRELSRNTQSVLSCLQRDGEVVVTNNGQPTILLVDLVGRDLIETVGSFRKARLDMPSARQQHDALLRFIEAVDARENEPLTDEDYAALENRRVNFKKDFEL
ncbi:MAG: hypothetical protein LBS19_09365, partial [Clostridiales bacterium]|jgi:hypothetical protein|nr:hypothetical protein [Clostridiales bacterium]